MVATSHIFHHLNNNFMTAEKLQSKRVQPDTWHMSRDWWVPTARLRHSGPTRQISPGITPQLTPALWKLTIEGFPRCLNGETKITARHTMHGPRIVCPIMTSPPRATPPNIAHCPPTPPPGLCAGGGGYICPVTTSYRLLTTHYHLSCSSILVAEYFVFCDNTSRW